MFWAVIIFISPFALFKVVVGELLEELQFVIDRQVLCFGSYDIVMCVDAVGQDWDLDILIKVEMKCDLVDRYMDEADNNSIRGDE